MTDLDAPNGPETPANTLYTVVGLGTEGDGLVETPWGPVFVPGALPGEHVAITDGRAGAIEAVTDPAKRQPALCAHFGRCGGCTLQHMSSGLYQRWKANLLGDALRTHGIAIAARPMISVPEASRRRAVLAVRRDGNDIELGFHERRSQAIERIETCVILRQPIMAGLPGITALASLLLARKSEARVAVLDTPHGLDIDFAGAKATFNIDARTAVVDIANRFRIARISVDGVLMLTRAVPALTMSGVQVVPPPGAFVQAAAEAETAMAALAVEAAGKSKRVVDLFSGLGTFTFALAARARVLAIDSDRSLITALADATRRATGLKPIETKIRDLFQDPLSPRELDGIDTVVFDPPRAGAKAQAEALGKSKVKTVVAISCNPATLARDLAILIDGGYSLKSVTPIDQFLYTPHLEAVAILRR